MWSDPEDIENWAVSPRGAGWLFGHSVTREVRPLLPLPTPHERRLGTLVVNIRPQGLHIREGRLLRLLDSVIYLGLCLLVEFLLDMDKISEYPLSL